MSQPMNPVDAFIEKWTGVVASELSTSQSFLIDLCHLLEVDKPHPTAEQDYMFERPITFAHGDGSTSAGRIDLYRRGAFVLESKKLKAPSHTKGFDDALLRARSQAEAYARALPAEEGRPPFVVVVDVGNRIELYAEFSRSGATYTPFPDPTSHRIALEDLRKESVRDRLRLLWADPLALDPSREAARVTREIAGKLAELAKSLEASGNAPEPVAQFLMRSLFTMFAEDVGLLPKDAFRDLLAKHADDPAVAVQMLAALWKDMDTGGFSAVLANKVLRFNGKLFKEPAVLPLTKGQLQALLEAAQADWRHVEPAIFGTLLERALSPSERHKLGAHYTPRTYVERLVLPTVIEPLRAEWSAAHAAALTLAAEEKPKEAVAELLKFHHRLCSVRILDPACGSSNFLYVALEHLKRLEGEVLNALDELGHRQSGLDLDAKRADIAAGETVDPHNLLGIEVNPRAAALAELVLWIGYLQWHFRTRGDVNPPEPVVRDFRNIENRDAVLEYDRIEPVTDEQGAPVTTWDGVTTKISPMTGEPVPDESFRKTLERYVNPRKAEWPEADFVVGNPPFIGNKRMRTALGDGYVEALRAAWPEVPDTSDFVMYWWHHAATLARTERVQRFGLITTNSLRMTFNRRVVEAQLTSRKTPLSLVFAVPDHPWVEAADGASVRISMTVGERARAGDAGPTANQAGRFLTVIDEAPSVDGEIGVTFSEKIAAIHADLTIGAKVSAAAKLKANSNVCFQGMNLVGKGFRLEPDEVTALGYDLEALPDVIKPHCNARELLQGGEHSYVIDFYGLSVDEARAQHPALLQRLIDRVKPERDQNKRESRRRNWWIFGEPVGRLRTSWEGLQRVILTPETAKHRVFAFMSRPFCPDHKLYALCLEDAAWLGVLSSHVHKCWALAAGGTLEDRPTWTSTTCFATFPFPDLATADRFAGSVSVAFVAADGRPNEATEYGKNPSERIRSLAEQIDTHRQRQQAAHPGLGLTGMYNVLDAMREGRQLTPKERAINDQGLVSVLRQLHDELDEAVLYAYGWGDLVPVLRVAHGNEAAPTASSQQEAMREFEETVLERLVALNTERAAEEAKGNIRWLRPDFQNAGASAPMQGEMEAEDDEAAPAAAAPAGTPVPWPKNTVDQVRTVADLLATSPTPLSIEDIGNRFTARGPWKKRLPQLLEMLVAVGRAEVTSSGRFLARK